MDDPTEGPQNDAQETPPGGRPSGRADALPETNAGAIRHVALVGSGVAGASLAMAWKAARPGLVVTGWAEEGPALDALEEAGALDRKAATPEAAGGGADLVLLAGRLPAALRRLEGLAPHLAPGTLVTDTGAAKQPIARHAAEVLPEGVSFVGGHPVAATEEPPETPPEVGRFDGGTYFLCPAPEAPASADALRARHPGFLALAEATGADVQVLSAARHDRLRATAHELPDVMASVLAEVVSEEGADGRHEALHALMPPAYRPLVWGRTPTSDARREERVAGEGALLDALGRYARALQQARRRLAAGEYDPATEEDAAATGA